MSRLWSNLVGLAALAWYVASGAASRAWRRAAAAVKKGGLP